MKIFGGALAVVGFFLLIGAPTQRRAQIDAYANMGRLLGIILIIIGVILLKF